MGHVKINPHFSNRAGHRRVYFWRVSRLSSSQSQARIRWTALRSRSELPSVGAL
jgi:hypothetical protein